MRFCRPSFVLALLVSLSAVRAADSTPANLTLEQALASVEKVNVTVLLGRETAAQAIEAVTQQRANVLPLVDLSVQQRRSQGVSIATVVVASGRPASRFDALLNANYAVLSPQRLSALKGIRAAADVAQANYQVVLQAVLSDVASTYFAQLRNMRRLDVLDANIARAQALLELARNQLAAGVATQIDVTRAEAQLALAEQGRLQQVTVVYQSELFLKRLLDLDMGSPLKPADFQVRRAGSSLYTASDQKSAFDKRAEYLTAQKTLEQVKIEVRTATFERLPSLNLSGNFGYASALYDDEKKQDQWGLGLALNVPVFDGLRAGANRRVALSRQRAQEMRLHNLELQISAELRLALHGVNSRNAQIGVAEKSLRLAQEELRLAQQRYQQGVADNREVVEAQNRLAVADDGFVEAVYLYNLSRVELARAKGDVRTVLAEKVE